MVFAPCAIVNDSDLMAFIGDNNTVTLINFIFDSKSVKRYLKSTVLSKIDQFSITLPEGDIKYFSKFAHNQNCSRP